MSHIFTLILLVLPIITSPTKQYYWLDQETIDAAGSSIVIKKAYSLLNDTIVLPKNFSLIFDGGTLGDGVIIGNESSVTVKGRGPVFGLGITIKGTWNQKDVYDEWFVFRKDSSFVSNGIIENMLALTDDNHQTHIHLDADRVYHVELPYKGRADIANKFTYTFEGGTTKKVNYADIYKDSFSFFRIFTIPSNTHLTVNNSIVLMPTNQGAYFLFWEYDKENVTVDGKGVISGDARRHIYTTPFIGDTYYGEWGMLFNCFKCRNFIFRDITLTDAFGDCLLYQGAYQKTDKGDRWSDGLLMENVKIRYARRNGVAIGARNVLIRNCTFEYCGVDEIKGTRPRSAIDFESDGIRDYPEIGNENVILEDCIFRNNFSDVTACRNNLEGYGKIATLVRNCDITTAVKMTAANWMKFENCKIATFIQSTNDRHIYQYCTNLVFENCSFGLVDREVLNEAKRQKVTYKQCYFEKIIDYK